MSTSVMERPNARTSIDGFPTVAPGADIHGELVSWEWAAGTESFGLTQVRESLSAAGLDPKIAREMLPKNAFARACKSLAERRIIRKITEDQTVVRFQFTAEHLAGDRFEYAIETILQLDKSTGDVTCDNPELAEKARAAIEAETTSRKPSDVSDIVQRLFSDRKKADLDLIPLRRQGGIYFVRRERLCFVDQVEDFLGRLGATIVRLPIQAGSEAGDRAIKVAVAERIQAMLGEFDAAVDGFTLDTSERGVNAAAERIKLIRFKVESYACYLQHERERLDAAVVAAQGRLRAKVGEITREREQRDSGTSHPRG